MWQKFKQTKVWKLITDATFSVLKGFAEKPLKMIITVALSMIGIVTASNPEAVFKSYQTFTTDQKMHDELTLLHEEARQLRDELRSANATNYYERRQFELAFSEFVKSNGQTLRILKDSISELNKKIISFSKGSGTVVIHGGGEVNTGEYHDDWIDATVEVSKERTLLNYQLNFELSDVSMTYEDKGNGSKNEIYSVKLRSKKNPQSEYLVGDYTRTTSYNTEQPKPIQKPQHTTLNADIVYAGYGVEAGASVSFWTFGNWKFPELGMSTEFENSTNIFSGVRYNIGSYLPLFSDLWISLKYGYNFTQQKQNALIGLGTTL